MTDEAINQRLQAEYDVRGGARFSAYLRRSYADILDSQHPLPPKARRLVEAGLEKSTRLNESAVFAAALLTGLVIANRPERRKSPR